ncbi:hypothetical protein RI030_12025 [Aphanizomenon flos-aquae NRERC-008]|uniref:Uncharacterized protein n=1 Tax=Aphanizomenon flos-aquae FACHB-1249 TaxID=2692889 RepID=A0ABR8IR69_APHFL|nr:MULTISPECIES: hypothetical protein [Aphanizomenon]MBD2390959.1 hypothetical protein [Aphanizomenon flos-aquae FACHB-1171]MBD2631921.1 hypothetical protein [Aphanizomenon sp. FACHB-1399]MBD2642785.1 hypothetical protein [Aphanizomenon sp. FACHB-1401]MBD2657711.1 hypothetical protein [Aphanizomenon flos-aquae FACHB-1265]MBD2672980.1 hypothetical protein [Aphanizomenon flos-aquae FACHB-1416]
MLNLSSFFAALREIKSDVRYFRSAIAVWELRGCDLCLGKLRECDRCLGSGGSAIAVWGVGGVRSLLGG